MVCKSISSKSIQSDMNYIVKNTSFQLATQALADEQRNFVTTTVLLHTSVLWFSHIASILADSCIIRTSCVNIVVFTLYRPVWLPCVSSYCVPDKLCGVVVGHIEGVTMVLLFCVFSNSV